MNDMDASGVLMFWEIRRKTSDHGVQGVFIVSRRGLHYMMNTYRVGTSKTFSSHNSNF